MAGRIPQAFIDDLVARADIVEVIGGRVQLKKAGREFKACCPFHNEKTPSFTVSQTKQFYHCFGCGAHGTALGFLMEFDKLSFVEAVEELASRLGLEVPREAGGGEPRPQSGEDLHELMGRVAQFYCDCLKDDQRAIDYLKGRGLTGETAAQFRIGYAPDSWNAVLRQFGDSENARRRLLSAGLTIERTAGTSEAEAGYYDRFRDRVMFPIRDARGRVIAFGGRVLDQGEPKYLNSPETPVFHKGKELYGLYEARQSRQALKRLLIVEGYMDVVRLHQAGISYALATLGTATTAEHLHRIFRLTAEVVFCFDGDRAGRAAAWRALEKYPHAHTSLLNALDELTQPPETIVLRGDTEKWRQELAKLYAPRRLVLAIAEDAKDLPEALSEKAARGDAVAYVCRGSTCSAPIDSLAALARDLRLGLSP